MTNPDQSPQAMPEQCNPLELDAELAHIRSRVKSFETALDDYLSTHAPARTRLKLLIRSLQTSDAATAPELLKRIDELIDANIPEF